MAKSRNYLKYHNETVIKDALYNLHPTSGATVEYCLGMVVGVAAMVMSQGHDFKAAIDTIACYMPDNGRLIVPESWIQDLQAAMMARGKKWSTPLSGPGNHRRTCPECGKGN